MQAPPFAIKDEDRQDFSIMYHNRAIPIRMIAEQFGISISSVSNTAKRLGLVMRGNGAKANKGEDKCSGCRHKEWCGANPNAFKLPCEKEGTLYIKRAPSFFVSPRIVSDTTIEDLFDVY